MITMSVLIASLISFNLTCNIGSFILLNHLRKNLNSFTLQGKDVYLTAVEYDDLLTRAYTNQHL